jgi:hypothetical protein
MLLRMLNINVFKYTGFGAWINCLNYIFYITLNDYTHINMCAIKKLILK